MARLGPQESEGNDEGEDLQTWTYAESLAEVERLANVLKSKGVKAGDRVTIFMPMVPQLPIAMLACARLGAVHSVVFGGFSAEALANRLQDAKSSVVITANGVMRGGKPSERSRHVHRMRARPGPATRHDCTNPSRCVPRPVALYDIVQKASELCADSDTPLTSTIVLQRLSDEKMPLNLVAGRDEWWHEVVPAAEPSCPVEWVDSEAPLFVLYTSGCVLPRSPIERYVSPVERAQRLTASAYVARARAAPPASRRASCTRRVATWSMPPRPPSTSLTSRTTTPSSAPPTAGGSRATRM